MLSGSGEETYASTQNAPGDSQWVDKQEVPPDPAYEQWWAHAYQQVSHWWPPPPQHPDAILRRMQTKRYQDQTFRTKSVTGLKLRLREVRSASSMP